MKGIVISVAEDCDPARLEFGCDLYVQEFTKTQFAGVKVHMKVLELLKTAFFRDLKVEDEGEYWETGNLLGLTEHIESGPQGYPSGTAKISTRPNETQNAILSESWT